MRRLSAMRAWHVQCLASHGCVRLVDAVSVVLWRFYVCTLGSACLFPRLPMTFFAGTHHECAAFILHKNDLLRTIVWRSRRESNVHPPTPVPTASRPMSTRVGGSSSCNVSCGILERHKAGDSSSRPRFVTKPESNGNRVPQTAPVLVTKRFFAEDLPRGQRCSNKMRPGAGRGMAM